MTRGNAGRGAKARSRHRKSKRPSPGTESIPIVDEQLQVVGTREVETGRVRISKRVVENEQVIQAALRRDDVAIERIPCDRVVSQASPIRTEGDVTIVPVYEEVLVKQLVLREELRIARRITVERRDSGPVVLRSEQVRVERMRSR